MQSRWLPLGFAIFMLLSGCASLKGRKAAAGQCFLISNERPEGYNFKALATQAMLPGTGKARGMVDDALVSLATNGIKKLIREQQKKYYSRFDMALTDLQFYNSFSEKGLFDPEGLQFKGLTLVRTVGKKGSPVSDTAFRISFVVDTTRVYEILNNSQFRLRLEQVDYRLPGVKVRKGQPVHIDVEITFSSSYVTEDGQFFANVPLGTFYYTLRNAPVLQATPSSRQFYDSLRGQPVTGYSFIIPRSCGYYVSAKGELQKVFSKGNFSVHAVVKESSKNSFVEKVIFSYPDVVVNYSEAGLKALGKKAGNQLTKQKQNAGAAK